MRSRIVSTLPPAPSSFSGGTFGGGGGGGVPSRFSRTTCRAAPARCGSHTTSPSGCCPARAGRRRTARRSQRHAPEVAAVDVRDAVVPRQPLVEERVVRAAADRARCGPRARCSRRKLGLAPQRLAQVVVEIREQPRIRRRLLRGCAGTATGRRSSSRAPRRAGRPACAAPAARAPPARCSLPRAGQVEQLVVRNAAPQEERQARRQFEVADAVAPSGAMPRRVPLDAEQESGLTSSARSAISMPASKPAPRRARPCRTSAGRRHPRRSRPVDTRGARASRGSVVAQASSGGGVVGRHMKMRRRLGVSPAPAWRRTGPAIDTEKSAG